jgi:Meiotically up-regulated gene 113
MNPDSTSSSLSLVYFVEAVGLDLIKIGHSRDIGKRMRRLSTGCPAPMRLLGTMPGGEKIERHYHERLAAFRVHGEWFRKAPEVASLLAGINAVPEPPPQATKRIKFADTYEEYEARCTRLFKQWAEEKRLKQEAREAKMMAKKMAKRQAAAPTAPPTPPQPLPVGD